MRRHMNGKIRVLAVCGELSKPKPDRSGGGLRIFGFLALLANKYRFTVIPFIDHLAIEESDIEFRRRWIDGQSCPIEIDHWRNAHPLAEEIRNMVAGPFMETVAHPPSASPSQLLKRGLKQLTPRSSGRP
jgi:hypothetical protein